MTVLPQEEEGKFYAEIERKCNVQLSNLAAKQEKALKAFDDKFANQRWCALPDLRREVQDLRECCGMGAGSWCMSGSWRSASCGSAIRTTSRTCAAPTSVSSLSLRSDS